MPVQALKLDLDGTDPVITGLRFTPRALFFYTTLSEVGVEEGTNAGSQIGTFKSLSVAHDGGAGGLAADSFSNPPVFVFGLGNSGANHGWDSSGQVIQSGTTITSWDPCGFTLSGTFTNDRVAGLAFGSDTMEYDIGVVSLPTDGSDGVVTGLGFEPQLVMLIRQVSGSTDDMTNGLGVWTASGQWFDGYFVPQLTTGPGFSHLAVTQYYDSGCAIYYDELNVDPDRVYGLTPDADGFTLSAVAGAMPGAITSTDYLWLAIRDDVGGVFQADTLVTQGGTETITGFGRPDALLVSRSNREVGTETSQDLPDPPGFPAADGKFALWSMGSCDRFRPAYGFGFGSFENGQIGLRVDPATGDGVYLVMGSGLATLLTIVGGVLGTLIDGAAYVPVEDDVIQLVLNGTAASVDVNASTILSGTQTDIPGSGRVFMAGQAYKEASAGTIGAPPLLDAFNRADNADVNTSWSPATNVFTAGGGVNMSVAEGQMAATDLVTQASYWSAASYTNAELMTVVGRPVFFDTEHNVWSQFVSLWSGLVRSAKRLMGGDPIDPLINWDYVDLGTYPTGPHLEIDATPGSGWGVTGSGWAGNVASDSGNHQVGWLLGKLGPSSGSGPCGFPERGVFVPQIYRRL